MRVLKYILVILLCLFSFYFSDCAILYVESKNPIMKTIKEYESDDVMPVNAVIEGNTIIPGMVGKKVDIRKSFLKMKDFGTFNENFFVYTKDKPEVSLSDNLDKVIIKGIKDNSIALVFDNINNIDNVKYDKLIDNVDDISNKYENINKINDKNINLLLSKRKLNKKICVLGYTNVSECKEQGYYLVSPSLVINKNNLINNILKIKSGDIILLKDDLSSSDINVIVNKIKYLNFNIIYLSELISED